MTDLTELMNRLADELPASRPPVPSLLRRGRRRARVRTAGAAATAAVLVIAVAVLVPAVGSYSAHRAGPTSSTAEQLLHGTWSTTARSPLGYDLATLTAAGSDVVELAPQQGPGRPVALVGAAVYDPETSSWRRGAGAVLGCSGWVPVWTGHGLFVWPGPVCEDTVVPLHHAAQLFDPARGTWSAVPTSPLPQLDESPAVVVQDAGVLVVGHANGVVVAATYDLSTRSWRRQDPPSQVLHQSAGVRAVATRGGALVWSLWRGPHGATRVDLLEYDGAWLDRSAAWRQGWVAGAVLAGSQLVVGDGTFDAVSRLGLSDSALARPVAVHVVDLASLTTRSTLSVEAFPGGGVWTGDRFVEAPLTSLGGGWLYLTSINITSGDQVPLPAPPQPISSSPLVWNGRDLFVLNSRGTSLLRCSTSQDVGSRAG